MILEPDYPHIVLAFPYRGVKIAIDQSDQEGIPVYAAWISYATGDAVAVPCAHTREEAIRRAKRWVDRRFV